MRRRGAGVFNRPPGLVLVTGLAAPMLAGCAGRDVATGREGDIVFAQNMIPHHAQALEMASLAIAADASPPITRLAREIQRAQEPEILLMRSWLAEWGAEELPHTGGPGGEEADHDHGMAGMATGEQLLALSEASGAEFDALWLDLMIAHHEGAIVMAEQVAEGTDDLEVQALADEVIRTQRAEIASMEGLKNR